MNEQDCEPVSVDPKLFHKLRVASGLALEINSGLQISARGSVMKLAAEMCGSTARTKVAVLRDYTAWLEKDFKENYPGKPAYVPNPSVRKAMGE